MLAQRDVAPCAVQSMHCQERVARLASPSHGKMNEIFCNNALMRVQLASSPALLSGLPQKTRA
jgi:hypothetical protein